MKRVISSLLIISLLFSSLVCCQKKDTPSLDADFTNVRWTRSTDADTEYIYFYDDGKFSYYCACGNPVADSDLCEGYTYDEKTLTVTLNYIEKTDESISKLTIKSCTESELVLDADGKIMTFTPESENEDTIPTDTVTYRNRTYVLLEYNPNIFNYDLKESIEYEEDTVYPIKDGTWDTIYYNGDLFIIENNIDNALAYYNNTKNYSWSVSVYLENDDEEIIIPLSMTDGEKAEILSFTDAKMTETVLFDDIEIHAMLVLTSDDGLLSASTSICQKDDCWYWRSEVIDENAEGWPEYIAKLPEGVSKQIDGFLESKTK